MSVSVGWDDNAHTRICFRITGRWTWDEFNWAWLESVAMVNSTPHKVNAIVDITEMINLPPDLLTRSVNIVRQKLPNSGVSILALNNGFMNMLFASLRRIAPRESAYLQIAPSMDAARRSLAILH